MFDNDTAKASGGPGELLTPVWPWQVTQEHWPRDMAQATQKATEQTGGSSTGMRGGTPV